MTERYKQILKFIAKLLVTVVLLLWVFSRIDLAQFSQTLRNAQWNFLWLVWGLTIVAYWILSIKMRLILKKQDCHASTGTLFGASAITALYSMPAICLALLILLITVCLSLLNRALGPKLINYLSHIIEPLPASFRSTGRKLLAQLSVFQIASWAFHFKVVLLNFVSITIVSTTIYIFAAKAARIEVPVGVFIWQCAVIFILGRLPISIANLGVREVTLVGTLALYGVDAPSAFLMSMIIFSNRILMAIIGMIFQLYWTMRRSEPRDKSRG